MKMDDSQPKLIQNWHKNGECPQGTISIRTQNNDLHRTFPFHRHERQHYYPFGQLLGAHEISCCCNKDCRRITCPVLYTLFVWQCLKVNPVLYITGLLPISV